MDETEDQKAVRDIRLVVQGRVSMVHDLLFFPKKEAISDYLYPPNGH